MTHTIHELTRDVQSVGNQLATVQQSIHETASKHSTTLRQAKQVAEQLERMTDTTQVRNSDLLLLLLKQLCNDSV